LSYSETVSYSIVQIQNLPFSCVHALIRDPRFKTGSYGVLIVTASTPLDARSSQQDAYGGGLRSIGEGKL
ncbi:uncharacterized protein QC761_0013070, partial [Podospora bellae-mahoneyi]